MKCTHTNMNTTPSALNMPSTEHQLASDHHQCINITQSDTKPENGKKSQQNSKSKMALNDCPSLTAYYLFLFCCCSPLIIIKWSIN